MLTVDQLIARVRKAAKRYPEWDTVAATQRGTVELPGPIFANDTGTISAEMRAALQGLAGSHAGDIVLVTSGLAWDTETGRYVPVNVCVFIAADRSRYGVQVWPTDQEPDIALDVDCYQPSDDPDITWSTLAGYVHAAITRNPQS